MGNADDDDDSDVVKCLQEYIQFRDKLIFFADPLSRSSAPKMAPASWWRLYGAATPLLQKVAIRVLSQVTSASSCERNWSSFEYIWSKKRNRLTPKKATKLVWVHCNARLMRKLKCHDYSEDYFEWDGVELEHEYERFAAEEPDNESEHEAVRIEQVWI